MPTRRRTDPTKIRAQVQESHRTPAPELPAIPVRLNCGHVEQHRIAPDKTAWLEAHGICELCKADAMVWRVG